jgi:hypothetical protein
VIWSILGAVIFTLIVGVIRKSSRGV